MSLTKSMEMEKEILEREKLSEKKKERVFFINY